MILRVGGLCVGRDGMQSIDLMGSTAESAVSWLLIVE